MKSDKKIIEQIHHSRQVLRREKVPISAEILEDARDFGDLWFEYECEERFENRHIRNLAGRIYVYSDSKRKQDSDSKRRQKVVACIDGLVFADKTSFYRAARKIAGDKEHLFRLIDLKLVDLSGEQEQYKQSEIEDWQHFLGQY